MEYKYDRQVEQILNGAGLSLYDTNMPYIHFNELREQERGPAILVRVLLRLELIEKVEVFDIKTETLKVLLTNGRTYLGHFDTSVGQ